MNALEPASDTAGTMAEQGPEEVRRAARAFNAMQTRIHDHLQERARILAAISHDLQTPITRMKLRVEMADQPELRDKLLQDLDNMTRPVREGIAFARTSQPLEEARQRLNLTPFSTASPAIMPMSAGRCGFAPRRAPEWCGSHRRPCAG